MRILTPEEAIPILLDRDASPVVALDTEFRDGPPVKTRLRGVSIAGGTPGNLIGAFWSFEDPWTTCPYRQFHERLIVPLFGDPDRTVVMHPWAVDAPIFRARGLTSDMIRCKPADTIAQAFIYDDNLPHGLKDLAYCLLLKTQATSYHATQKEIEDIRKEGGTLTKAITKQVWDHYAEHRRKSTEIEVDLDPSAPGWMNLAMDLPPGMNRNVPKTWKCGGKKGCGFSNITDTEGLAVTNLVKTNVCGQCGRERRVKLGVEYHVKPIIEKVVQADFDRKAQDRFEKYGAEDAIYTLAIHYVMYPTLNKLQREHLQLETDITYPVVVEMHERGLRIDVPRLADIHRSMSTALAALRARVIAMWTLPSDEGEFNPASPDQVVGRVWRDWGLRPPPWAMSRGNIKPKFIRKKDGFCTTNRAVLTWLAEKHKGTRHGKAIFTLTEFRRWEKLMTTYVDPMLAKAIADRDDRIHSSFWPTGARSGRFSSSDPNVENIPRGGTMPTLEIPTEADPESPPPGLIVKRNSDEVPVRWQIESLREVFIPGFIASDPVDTHDHTQWRYVSADLSQIENRLTAHESQDKTMLWLYRAWDCAECNTSGETGEPLHACPNCGAADGKRDKYSDGQPAVEGFCLGRDIHAATAFAIPGFIDTYGPKDGRQNAKAINHGATYGMSAGTISVNYGLPKKLAQAALDAWHVRYPGVRENLHTRVRRDAGDKGFITMFDGHIRRFLSEKLLMDSGNFRAYEWEGIIRQGVNVLAQGGTGIIMKRAMVKIRNRFQEPEFKGRVHLINQVHDECNYEAHVSVADKALAVTIYEMEHAAPEIGVPILADGAIGLTWGSAH